MGRLKAVFTNARVLILLAFLVLAVVAIRPEPWKEGVAVRSVLKNSSAEYAGIQNPKPGASLMSREVILAINGQEVRTVTDYDRITAALGINETVLIKTSKQTYRLTTRPKIIRIPLNETEMRPVEKIVNVTKDINGTTQEVEEIVTEMQEVQKFRTEVIGTDTIGIRVQPAPKSNLRKGLDLEGGTRVLLKPEEPLSTESMDFLLENMRLRLNNYGLSDMVLRSVKDLEGNQFVLVEIAGVTEEDVRELLAKQGKFEAKIGNRTVFIGGQDITYVCRSADCAGIDPQSGCNSDGGNWFCRFRFSISLSPGAAQRQADITQDLDTIGENGEQYLTEKLRLILDNQEVDQLSIGSDLKGRAVTDIAISGSGTGITQEQAVFDALQNMKKLQTVLITGSLPVKLEVVKIDTLSPQLGEEFLSNTWFIGIISMIVVSLIVGTRYRNPWVSIPMVITIFSEILLMLGFAALIRWNMDLAALAGIVVATGTGVDDQIVITDEALRGGGEKIVTTWKEKFKKAFFIVFVAYAATVVAMLPLMFAGAGLLKGFAFTTIVGITFGVLVTRPAYAAVVEILVRE